MGMVARIPHINGRARSAVKLNTKRTSQKTLRCTRNPYDSGRRSLGRSAIGGRTGNAALGGCGREAVTSLMRTGRQVWPWYGAWPRTEP